MKYKIYCNNKEYKVPSATVYGYGDVIKAPWGEDVAIRLWDGDIMYLQKDNAESGYDYVLYSSLESGLDYSIFYVSPINEYVDQSGSSGWLCFPDTLQEHGDFLRIYKFYEDPYDLDVGGEINDEQSCRQAGTLVAILQFTTDANGEEVWRFLDPTICKYNGQWIDLPNMQDKLFISYWLSKVRYGEMGFYYVFDSGTEGFGVIKDRYSTDIYGQSFSGWFGDRHPTEDWELYIYHCGEGFYETDLYGSISDYHDFDEMNSFFASQNIKPTILRYNEDTELWYLVQEGTRYDY